MAALLVSADTQGPVFHPVRHQCCHFYPETDGKQLTNPEQALSTYHKHINVGNGLFQVWFLPQWSLEAAAGCCTNKNKRGVASIVVF